MATNYTIRVINQSAADKSFYLFQQPAPRPGAGLAGPIYSTPQTTFASVADGGFESITFTVETEEAPRFLVAEGAYPPGQAIVPSQIETVATVDFTGRPQTAAEVTEHPDASVSVTYS